MNRVALAVAAAVVFSLMAAEVLCCEDAEEIGASCYCVYEKVTCTCTEQALNLTYENMDEIFVSNVKEFRLENCKKVTVNEGILVHFISLKLVVFNKISTLVLLPNALEFFGKGMLKIQQVEKVILHQDSILIQGDSMANVTVQNSGLVSSSESQASSPAGSVGGSGVEATFKCDCQRLYWLGDSAAITVMEWAIDCTVLGPLKETCKPKMNSKPNGSASVPFSLFTIVLGLVFITL